MSTNLLEQASGKLRVAMGIFGLISLAAGIAIMVWPTKTAMIVTGIFAVYVIVAGLAYAGAGLFSQGMGFGARFWRIILGAIFVISGVVALGSLQSTAAFFFVFMAIMIGVTWIYEGFIAFASMGSSSSKGWTFFYGFVSILAGLTIVFSPLYSTVALWWVIGLSAMIYGIVEIIQSFRS